MEHKRITSMGSFIGTVIALVFTGVCYALGALLVFTLFGIEF